jgi:hypothetical protein
MWRGDAVASIGIMLLHSKFRADSAMPDRAAERSRKLHGRAFPTQYMQQRKITAISDDRYW